MLSLISFYLVSWRLSHKLCASLKIKFFGIRSIRSFSICIRHVLIWLLKLIIHLPYLENTCILVIYASILRKAGTLNVGRIILSHHGHIIWSTLRFLDIWRIIPLLEANSTLWSTWLSNTCLHLFTLNLCNLVTINYLITLYLLRLLSLWFVQIHTLLLLFLF